MKRYSDVTLTVDGVRVTVEDITWTPGNAPIGEVHGLRVILAEIDPDHRGARRVLVRCQCGDERIVHLTELRRGRHSGCRSCRSGNRSAPDVNIGDKFGLRRVTAIFPATGKGTQTMIGVICVCNWQSIVALADLKRGRAKGCIACRMKRKRDAAKGGHNKAKKGRAQ